MTINLRKITQGERGTLTFTWEFPENITSPASISGATITATMTDEDGVTTAVSGTLTGTAATTCTWALSAGDSGTAGTFTVLFKAVATGVTTYTLEATLEVIANPSVTGTQNDPLVSISAADAAWVTLAATAVPDGGDVVDANDLGTAAYAATGDFDAAGAAAAAQAAAVQRANHTGTQTLSTISDAGTMAAQAVANYYTKTDHSAAPAAAEPVKADGSGGVQIKSLAITGNDAAYGTNSLRVTNSAAAIVINTTNDGRTSFGAKSANNSVVDINLGGAKTSGIPLTISSNGGVLSASAAALFTSLANFDFGSNSSGSALRLVAPNNYALSIHGSKIAVNRSTSAPTAQIDMSVDSAATIGEIIRLAAGQTANALEVRSNAGAVLAKIEPDGEIQAAGYRSSDGTAGWTGTFLNGSGATVTVKNGLITGVA